MGGFGGRPQILLLRVIWKCCLCYSEFSGEERGIHVPNMATRTYSVCPSTIPVIGFFNDSSLEGDPNPKARNCVPLHK